MVQLRLGHQTNLRHFKAGAQVTTNGAMGAVHGHLPHAVKVHSPARCFVYSSSSPVRPLRPTNTKHAERLKTKPCRRTWHDDKQEPQTSCEAHNTGACGTQHGARAPHARRCMRGHHVRRRANHVINGLLDRRRPSKSVPGRSPINAWPQRQTAHKWVIPAFVQTIVWPTKSSQQDVCIEARHVCALMDGDSRKTQQT